MGVAGWPTITTQDYRANFSQFHYNILIFSMANVFGTCHCCQLWPNLFVFVLGFRQKAFYTHTYMDLMKLPDSHTVEHEWINVTLLDFKILSLFASVLFFSANDNAMKKEVWRLSFWPSRNLNRKKLFDFNGASLKKKKTRESSNSPL